MKLSIKRPRIGCILASVHTGSALILWSRLAAEANRTGGSFFVFPGGRLDNQTESEYLRNSIYKLVNTENLDGVISWGSTIGGSVSQEELNRFHEALSPLPYVTIAHKMPNNPCISFDAYSGMKDLVKHFIHVHGSKKIAFLRGPSTHVSACERYQAFLDVLHEEGLYNENTKNLITDPFPWTEGENAIIQLYEQRRLMPGQDYDTLIGSSDMMLFSAVSYLQNYGFRIPHDLKVAAFNDSAESRIFSTPFSTVHMPYEDLGLASYKMIRTILQNNGAKVDDVVLPASVVIRESCGCNRILELSELPVPDEISEQEYDQIQEALFKQLSTFFNIDDSLAQALISPLLIALRAQDTSKFFDLFEMVLNRFFGANGEIRVLFEAITLVQQSGLISPSYYEKISTALYQQIIQLQSSALSLRKYESEKRYAVLNSLKCGLLAAHNKENLMKILQQHLPQIGIHTVAVVTYEDDEFSRYIGGFSQNTYLNTENEPVFQDILFPATLMLPTQVQENFDTGVFIVQPLFIENQPLGYIVNNVNFYDGSVYEDLRSAISGSLHGILLFEQSLVSKKLAERAEHAKEEFFSNIGTDLSDPLLAVLQKLDTMEENLKNGSISEDIFSEQLLFVKSHINNQVDKTNMLVDLTLSQLDDLSMDKRLFLISDIIPTQERMPLLYGDPDRLARAIRLIRDEYNSDIKLRLLPRGLAICFITHKDVTLNWSKPALLLAEKIISLLDGEIIQETGSCKIVLPYPSLAGISSCAGRTFSRVYSFSGDLSQLLPFDLPIIQKNTGNYSEFSRIEKTADSLIAWDFDAATMKDMVNMYSLRLHAEFFRSPMLCFASKVSGETLLDMLEVAVRTKKDETVLFIDTLTTQYEHWAVGDSVLSISSVTEIEKVLAQSVPSLIVFEKIDLEAIRIIRKRPNLVLVPILILLDTVKDTEEFQEVSTLPRVIICNKGVGESEQFGIRIKEILAGEEILPPHTGALVKRAILYLNENASSQIVRWKLASYVHVSEDYLTRIFHKEIGLSLWEYLNRYRIFLATDMLLNTNGTIYEIAEKTGFQDQAYFCRVFKKIHGVPPGKIRSKVEKRSG